MRQRSALRKFLKTGAKHLHLAWHDSLQNRLFARADQRFLVVRHPGKTPFFYDIVLHWLEQNFPKVRALFELHTIPFRIRPNSRYLLQIPWLQDPVQNWSQAAYRQANELAAQCDMLGIPVINRVDRLTSAAKSTGARLIGSVGIRTPKTALIHDVLEFRETHGGLELPLLVRENWGHGGLVCRANTRAEFQQLPLEQFTRPVAIELIEVQSQHDGLYRKYRYIAAGDWGIPQSMHVSKGWKVKGTESIETAALRDEEITYTNLADPNHELLQTARKALGLDFVAFDYSYDREGRMVVWEANPYPYIHFPSNRRSYRQPAIIRTLAGMINLYLRRAALAVPREINDLLETLPSASLPARIAA